MEHFVQYKNAILYYSKLGNGPHALLAFHGFGQSKEVFHAFADALASEYTVYSFDLFFHGNSKWTHNEQPLEKKFWNEIIQQVLIKHNITSLSIIGYSMGGKFALATLEEFSAKVKEIFLLAPDGIWLSPWYTLATGVLRNLFKSMIVKPNRFQLIASAAKKLRLIDQSTFRFTETQMNNQEKREQVYYSWVMFRKLKFNMAQLSEVLNANNIPVTVIIGKFDTIFPGEKLNRALRNIKSANVEVLESGHNSLIRKSIPVIKSRISRSSK